MILDAGMTVAESRATLNLQRDQLIAGLRDAMLYPVMNGDAHVPLALPDGMKECRTDDGLFHFNPGRISADEIADLSRVGRLNNLLGLGPYSKSDIASRIATGEPPLAVVEISPNGTEVKAAWGTTSTAPYQYNALEASKTPGHLIMITSPLHVLVMRLAALATTGK